MIFYIFVIKIVHINICPILDNYGAMAALNLEYTVSIIENNWDKIINQLNT
jgi:hypothetical protein